MRVEWHFMGDQPPEYYGTSIVAVLLWLIGAGTLLARVLGEETISVGLSLVLIGLGQLLWAVSAHFSVMAARAGGLWPPKAVANSPQEALQQAKD